MRCDIPWGRNTQYISIFLMHARCDAMRASSCVLNDTLLLIYMTYPYRLAGDAGGGERRGGKAKGAAVDPAEAQSKLTAKIRSKYERRYVCVAHICTCMNTG